MCALFVAVLGGIIAASISTKAQDQISDNNYVLNISIQANFNIHFEQKHHEIISINIEDDIKDVMTRKPISKVIVNLMESMPDSEKDENDTTQIFED